MLVSVNFFVSPSSQTQGLLARTMRYFRAKVYFKSWRAPGNLFLPNQFQKWSNSVPLIGQKNMSNQRWGLDVELCRLLTRSSFLQRSPTQLLGPYNGKIVVDGFRKKKYSNEAEETASLDMAARKQYCSINFLGGFIAISTLLFLVAGKASRIPKVTYYFSLIVEWLLKPSTICKMQIAVARPTQLCRPNVRAIG